MQSLPHYKVRESVRAKRVQIKLNQFAELEIVIPKGFAKKDIAKYVVQHRHWIHRARARILALRPPGELLSALVPEQVYLAAINKCYRVTTEGETLNTELNIDNGFDPEKILLHGSQAQQITLLNQWMQKKAKKILPPWLQSVSAEFVLKYNKVTIRCQKTRWGSCSHRHNINLNRNLLLLVPELVRYLLIHELCHTVHFNHTESYWRLVAQFEPGYKALDKQLNHATRTIPRWACKS